MAVALSVEMLLFSSLFLLPISVISQNKGGVEVGSSQTATTVISQNNGRVEVGSSLNATTGYSSSWLSPSGDFAFGFSPLGNNDLFLLSIWYAKIPDKTVVWYAHDGHNTMVAPRGSVLKLTADSGLVLNNPKGGEIWKSGKTFVENGVMNDTGNFVLQDENSGSLWETFSYPTDTVLPGQTIERNGKLTSRQSELSSRQSETNYTKGRFQLHLQNDGNLVLNTVNLPTDNANFTYFDTKTTDGVVRGSQGKQLVFDSSGDMFVLRENDGRFPLFSLAGTEGVSVRDNYIRATLDFDGIFALYSHPKNFTENARWSGPLRYMPDGTCRDCGYNITCKLKPDNKRPTCECLKGFSSLDPKDIYGGCRKSVRRVASVLLDKWVWIGVSITAALVLCTAYYLLRRRSSALASAGGDRARKQNTWLCLSKSDKLTDEPDQENMGKHDLSVFTDGSDKLTDEPDQENMGKHGLRVFKYESVQTATSNFSEENKLGEGGFGPVYKGKLVTGREIAVKKLSKSSRQGNSEFENEVKLTHKLQHTNLVQLFGYCIHEDERMLIYEYMPNKSLDYHIFDSSRGELLDWKKRFGIIEGITQGLLYLHRYSRMTVIHRDLKASNILLDENMNPKIADFGLARVFTHTESEANASRIVGTPGSVKSDVYNFGVLILEIISGQKKDCCCNNNNCSLDLVGHSWELWKQNAELKLKDRSLGDSCDRNQLLRCIHVSLLCVDENAADRPTMSDVISMLTNESMELRKPKKPAYYTQGNVYCTGEQAGSRNYLDDSDIGGR